MKIIRVYPRVYGSLNMRQLLTPLFYGAEHAHPDSSRQRKARQRAKDRRAARKLKAQYVPLCFVDPTCYVERMDYDGRRRYDSMTPTGRLLKKPVQAVWMPSPKGDWRRHELSA